MVAGHGHGSVAHPNEEKKATASHINIDQDFSLLGAGSMNKTRVSSTNGRPDQLVNELAPKIYNAIVRDDIANTLKQNSVSAEFFQQESSHNASFIC